MKFCLACILLMICTCPAAAADIDLRRFALDPQAITADSTVHPVNVLGDSQLELVTVRQNTVAIHQLTPTGFQLVQTLSLPQPTEKGDRIYYGFARLEKDAPRSLVVMLSAGIVYYPVEGAALAAQPTVLFKTDLVQSQDSRIAYQYFDLALDLDNDGVDELLLPEENGFSISRRTEDGTYKKLTLPRNAFKRENTFNFSRDVPDDPSRAPFVTAAVSYRRGVDDLLFYDSNGDEKLDLIYTSTALGPDANEVERYDVFLQQDDMSFDKSPSQSIAVPYDSSADATFRDINQDGKLDAILVRSNLDIVNPRTLVKFYIGSASGYQVFSKESDRFVTKDPIGLVQLADFNADGATDFAMTFFSYQFGSVEDIVDMALASKIRFKLQFFLGQGKQGYNRQPSTEKEITLNTKMENFRGNPPVMLVSDMNGDKMMDLVVRSSEDELDVYLSTGTFAFPARPNHSLKIPADASIVFEDMNADGLIDLIISSRQRKFLTIYLSVRK